MNALVLRETEYDIYTRDALAQELESLAPGMAIDFRNVRYLDSSGIGVLVVRARQLRESDGVTSIPLINVASAVGRIITIAGLDALFEIGLSPEQAV